MNGVNYRQTWQFTVSADEVDTAVNYLCQRTGLSKGRLKDAMNKGAVWLQSDRNQRKRLRRATALLKVGDRLSVYYDPGLLAKSYPMAHKLWESAEYKYSLWHKPAGLLSQGTDYGDHASLLRQIQLSFKTDRDFLVHRLDREASGLVLIAHSANAARRLSSLFQQGRIHKTYEVVVSGRPSPETGQIALPLDGKSAITHYELIQDDSQRASSLLRVKIETGRRHQIRRHLAMIGHPVMGDPLYGKGNKNLEGLQLRAVRLEFICPFSRQHRDFILDVFPDD